MHHKDIKARIRKQLKTHFPNWHRLTRKEKKEIARQVLEQVIENYDSSKKIATPVPDLIGLSDQQPTEGIMTVEQMAEFIAEHQSDPLFRLYGKHSPHPAIKDIELQYIDSLIDDRIVNKILAPDGYKPAIRYLFPCNMLRAEILKAIKYPEISYRKFCGDDKTYENHKETGPYIGMENKQNRAFIGLSLNRREMINHVQMSQFRSSLSFTQMINLNVYILYLLQSKGMLDPFNVHFVDSTELAVDRQYLLAKFKIGNQNIRIYDDIDCDCGKRRNKRDKSVYVVGYRLHALAAINPENGQSIPLISLLAPANHHDSNFTLPLIQLGKAIGLDLKLITADEAYHDKDGSLLAQTGVHVIAPPNRKVTLPGNVDPETYQVTCDDFCEIAMDYVGSDSQGHEFKCAALPGQCSRMPVCPQCRRIEFDSGCFQPIPHATKGVSQAIDLRKNGERIFNLLKKREGLDYARVRGQHNIFAQSIFANAATLLIEMAGTRSTRPHLDRQLELLSAA
ncbi:hypothetical protein DSCO28_72980 (plasmid) [Desulfosarcina ovata subsp. sediminis]|uniref:Transposase n=1 Tax=Desulfosarcina ovata subsp. sediminis TaxID=885957 RepID=A0A5K7ZHP1_9BACT|nr:transposase [Desulfosarcina ovata]BBO79729.1 hypothetical protein DSCO28_02950 [Desulfosarcina ovata subsp. sediminis]BBO80864.1 hypothetical protein DSCO28_14300 [Desulfosarcina ovata subsp. sediminis]BBO80919.1 hypothetical protein DSCO28_14850 [Desulfosarcina ovata subsp. sediminis]BBO81785.1 hypothetical protein DSCO28_23510 [Desulfosarcina ovata subsp. sediminis]BBO83951.1 hypothetical protein DSCO28_45170 [Desulfosarcina ovata subsp. sediminis]